MHKLPLTLTLLALAGTSSAPARAQAKPRLLLATGQVKLAHEAGGWRLAVGVGGGARVLIGRSLVMVADGARLTSDREGMLRLEEGARLAFYGTGALTTPLGWRIEVSSGALLLERGTLHLVAGRARLAPPGPGLLLLEAGDLGRRRRPRALIGPARASLGLDGELSSERWDASVARVLEAALLRAASGAPPRWAPAVSQPSVSQARRMVRLGRQRQQAARETASCGCTEGQAGDSSGTATQGPANQPLEKRNATIRVRVRGVPVRAGD